MTIALILLGATSCAALSVIGYRLIARKATPMWWGVLLLAAAHLAGYLLLATDVTADGVVCGSAMSWFDSSQTEVHPEKAVAANTVESCRSAQGIQAGISIVLIAGTALLTALPQLWRPKR